MIKNKRYKNMINKKLLPQRKYIAENITQERILLNKKYDQDIFERVSLLKNKNGYYKALIRADKELWKNFKKD